ncbi:MAG: DUF4855 domain-containing protein [Clostridia bacterium]|nr:DUF4855 domain-containing protein [Clostridia bacterium]
MKRWLALLLLASMLFASACSSTQTTSGDPSSLPETESSEDTSSEAPSGDEKHTVVSVGKPYTSSSQPESRYADLFGQQITDGQKAYDTASHYTDVRLVGYTQDTRIDIDLGEDGKAINGASVRALDINTDGVKLAKRVRFYGKKTESDAWESIGRANFEATGDKTISTATLYFDEPVDYRYIRASISLNDGAHFFFIDEVEVYANVDAPEETNTADVVYDGAGIDRGEWATLSTGVTAAPVDKTNVAKGLAYTFKNCKFDSRAPESNTLLTDGDRTTRRFGDAVWVGIKAEGTPSISMDLKKNYDNLYGVRIHTLGAGLNVTYPGAIDVYASKDNKSFVLAGRIYAPANVANHAYTLLLPEYINARYLRFEFVGGDEGQYIWIEEIEVLAGHGQPQSEEHFPELNLPIVTEDAYWDATDSDYNTYKNLLAGLTQQVAASDYVASVNPHLSAPLSPYNATMLTDGKHGNVQSCYSAGWFFFHGGNALDFFYDLGKLSTVDKVTISLLENRAWGITRPKFHSVFLSDDGETWYKVADYQRPADQQFQDGADLTFEYQLDQAYAARFVRFRIECQGFLFVDEFEAYGTKEVKADAVRLEDSGKRFSIFYTNPERAQFASAANTGVRAEEIALLWGGNEGADNMLMGFAAYLDEEGNIKDTMMDGFMYFPDYHLPTGVQGYQASGKADWDYMFETTFDGKNGLEKLNQVVGEVKAALNIPDYKVYVYFPFLRLCDVAGGQLDPKNNVKNFGDVDGDGVSEDTSKAEDRQKIFDWYTEKVMTEFATRDLDNLVFDGFCWVNEDVGYEIDDSHIITEAGDACDKVGTNLLWIPYYTATRYYMGHEMGVDVTNMQPNYMFDLEQSTSRLVVTSTRLKWMQMCVEIEHNFEAFADPLFLRNYMLYLYYGAVSGYMDSIHIYYDNIENISLMAYSDDPMIRFQYEATYHFIKGDLEVTPETRETIKLSTKKGTVLEDTLNTENSFSLYTLTSDAKHGTVSLATDGTLRYYPDKDFTGTDSFTYTYNNYLGESETCTVEITVE